VVNLLTKAAAFAARNAGNCFSNLSKKMRLSAFRLHGQPPATSIAP